MTSVRMARHCGCTGTTSLFITYLTYMQHQLLAVNDTVPFECTVPSVCTYIICTFLHISRCLFHHITAFKEIVRRWLIVSCFKLLHDPVSNE